MSKKYYLRILPSHKKKNGLRPNQCMEKKKYAPNTSQKKKSNVNVEPFMKGNKVVVLSFPQTLSPEKTKDKIEAIRQVKNI